MSGSDARRTGVSRNEICGNGTEQRDNLLLSSLAAAYAEMETLQGPVSKEWKWGKLHHNFSEHPFSRTMDEPVRNRLNVGPIETAGSSFTVNASSYRADDFLQTGGPSVRMVLDVGNWDNSKAVNHPGNLAIQRVRIIVTSRRCGATASISLCFTAAEQSRTLQRGGSSSYQGVLGREGALRSMKALLQ